MTNMGSHIAGCARLIRHKARAITRDTRPIHAFFAWVEYAAQSIGRGGLMTRYTESLPRDQSGNISHTFGLSLSRLSVYRVRGLEADGLRCIGRGVLLPGEYLPRDTRPIHIL